MCGIAYYADGLERKRSVYERDIDPSMVFLAGNGVCRKGEERALQPLFAEILSVRAMFDDSRHYGTYDVYDRTSSLRATHEYNYCIFLSPPIFSNFV